jgi:hypothetical protein
MVPELPHIGPERIGDDAAAFNERIRKLTETPEFRDDHLAREEAGVTMDQLQDDLDANRQAVYSDVHKFLPEIAEPVTLHDGDMISGLEYHNGRLSFHGERYGVLDGKRIAVALDAHERRSGTVVTNDGRVLPFTVEGNSDAEQDDDLPQYPTERRDPLPPLYATGGVPPELRA